MKTESTETQEKKLETLEEAAMAVLKETYELSRFETDPARRMELYKRWTGAIDAFINSEGRNKEAEKEMNELTKRLGLSKEFEDAYAQESYLSQQSYDPPDTPYEP